MSENLYAQQMPRDGYQHGKQPIALKNAGVEEKVAVIGGAGWAHKQYLATVLEHRGSEVLIVDPNEWGEQKRQYGPNEHSFLDEKPALKERLSAARQQNKMPEDLAKDVVQALKEEGVDYIVISSPSSSHAAYIKAAQELGMPAIVQSPMVAGADPQAQQDARAELDQFMKEKGNAPLYVMNPGAIAAAPLLEALGKETGMKKFIEGDVAGFDAFKADEIKSVEINHMEGWIHPENRRNELPARYDLSHGGGALNDSAIMPLGALAEAEIVPMHVLEAMLKPVNSSEAIASGDILQTENLAQATMIAKQGEREIAVSLVAGKRVEGYEFGESITLVDVKGNKLTYEKSADKELALVAHGEKAVKPENRQEQNVDFAYYHVKLENAAGQLLAQSEMRADPYALAAEEATKFFAQNKEQGQGEYTAATMHYDTQSAALSVLENIHAKGRGIELEPSVVADLGAAEIVPQKVQGQGRH